MFTVYKISYLTMQDVKYYSLSSEIVFTIIVNGLHLNFIEQKVNQTLRIIAFSL